MCVIILVLEGFDFIFAGVGDAWTTWDNIRDAVIDEVTIRGKAEKGKRNGKPLKQGSALAGFRSWGSSNGDTTVDV